MIDAVIITRNEATRIGKCIESVLAATATRFSDARIVVIDSNSVDATVSIAARYPVKVFRYRAPRMSAAAGRWIGFQQVDARYVLFLDGDCTLVAGWLEIAIERMEAEPSAGVICGARKNAHVHMETVELRNAGSDLGGTALYRYEALVRSKGFNPFIIGSEEQELSVRLHAHGFQSVRTTQLMSVHNTARKESLAGMWRRYRSGMHSGPGQVLRIALADGLFLKHTRRFNRYIVTCLYLVAGALSIVLALFGRPSMLGCWIGIGLVGFLLLGWQRRSLHDAAFIVIDWVSVAVGSIWTFLQRPRPPDTFDYTLECVSGSGCDSAQPSRPSRAPS